MTDNSNPEDIQPNLPARQEQGAQRKTFVLKRRSEPALPHFAIRYADELNAAQLAAVEQVDGPVLVVAGAGTGKTRTLVYRVSRMIELGIRPEKHCGRHGSTNRSYRGSGMPVTIMTGLNGQ